MRILWKTVVYLLLIVGSVLMSLPFAWMLSTALKPIEQTMSMPPNWLPYRYYAEIDGKREAVVPVEKIISTAYVADDGTVLRRRIDAGGASVRVVRASEDAPIFKVVLEDDRSKWALLAASDVSRRVEPRWENFVNAVREMRYFPRYLWNTLLLCVLTVVGSVASSSLAAYGFSRIEWKGRDKIFAIVLATMMVPFPVVMVPLYCLFRWLGMIGTLQPLWVGSFFAQAFNVFLLRQFFMGIPKDLSDAARIDGCGEFTIFLKVILPAAKPALVVVALLQFLFTWNDFLGPLIYLTDQSDYTLALGLQFFQSQNGGTEWHYLMAASILVIAPIMLLFVIAQRSFIQGISMTGMKG
jgi:multiple sugar transport system permease protein